MNFYIKVIPINEGKNALTQKLSVFLNHYRYYENLATAKNMNGKEPPISFSKIMIFEY